MIDRRELLEKARERNLTRGMIEKDYVLGWLLFGLKGIKGLVFKGGTALSKIYFPETWRLSEDLDFVYLEDFGTITEALETVFEDIKKHSGIKLRLKSRHENPSYLQLKIQYDAVLGKNWIKVDITREAPIDKILKQPPKKTYSDYPNFRITVETIEEIAAQKIRSLIERRKCRDYFDIWQLMQMELHTGKLASLIKRKFSYKDLEFPSLQQFFPKDLHDILRNYWKRELGRLVSPLPEMDKVLSELKHLMAPLFT